MSTGHNYDSNDQDSEHTPTPSPNGMNIPSTYITIRNSSNESNHSNGSPGRDRKVKSKPHKSKSRSSSHREHRDQNHRDRRDYRDYSNAHRSSTKHRGGRDNNNHRQIHHHQIQYENENIIVNQQLSKPKPKPMPYTSPSKSKSSKRNKPQNLNKRAIINDNIIAKKQHIEQLPNRKKLVIIAVGDNPLPSHAAFDFIHCKVGMERKVMWKHFDVMVLIVPTNTSHKNKEIMFEACKKAKKINPKLFVCIIDIEASESAVFRSRCFGYGANMVTNDHHSLKQVLNIIGNKGFKGNGRYSCPYCGMNSLSEDELWHHVPLYHINDNGTSPLYLSPQGTPQQSQPVQSASLTHIHCPICNKEEKRNRNFMLHLRNYHGPVHRGERLREYRDGILTHAFALVVVRRPTDNKFLVVQEACNSGFWLPGGRVEVGETLLQAAIRETKQEAGINIDIKGILKIEHSTYSFDDRKKAYNRMRIIFYAEPCDEKELPKSIPNYNSAGATFISIEELDEIELRADEPREWFNSLTQNFYYHSLDLLSCWKHDHTTAPNRHSSHSHNSDPSGAPPTPQQQTIVGNENTHSPTHNGYRHDFIESDTSSDEVIANHQHDAHQHQQQHSHQSAGSPGIGDESSDELTDDDYKQRVNKNTNKRRHTANAAPTPTSPFTQFQAQISNNPNIRMRGSSDTVPPPQRVRKMRSLEPAMRFEHSAPSPLPKPNKMVKKTSKKGIKRSKTPTNLNSLHNSALNLKAKSQKNLSKQPGNLPTQSINAMNDINCHNPVANKSNPTSPPSPQPPHTQQQLQQVTYMIAPSMNPMMYPQFIPNLYYPTAQNMQNMSMPGLYQQRQSLLQIAPQNLANLQKQMAMEQDPATPDFYLQQMALQQQQQQQQYPYYAQTQHQAAQHGMNGMYQVYAPPPGGTVSQSLSHCGVPIANFHNQLPRPELKLTKNTNSNPKLKSNGHSDEHKNRNKKKKKTTVAQVSQSDSLLRKKSHRRSSSNTLPQRNTLQSHFSHPHHNTTPPPGLIYSDQLNKVSAQRGIVGGSIKK